MDKLTSCKTCSKEVAQSATVCPHERILKIADRQVHNNMVPVYIKLKVYGLLRERYSIFGDKEEAHLRQLHGELSYQASSRSRRQHLHQ